jgi:hypothetical protein
MILHFLFSGTQTYLRVTHKQFEHINVVCLLLSAVFAQYL